MRKAEKRELMLQWFGQNYEDPAERTSYVTAEGGYLWNYGGPYDATEELFGKFGDIVSESFIKEVADEVEAEGITDWTHTARAEDYNSDELPPELSPFDTFTDKETKLYGSPQDYEARELARVALQDLIAKLGEEHQVGIGHNNPPEETSAELELLERLTSDAQELHAEFGKPNPSISLVKRVGASLGKFAEGSIKWIGRKADLAVNVAITAAVPALILYHISSIQRALDAIIAWLCIVAQKF